MQQIRIHYGLELAIQLSNGSVCFSPNVSHQSFHTYLQCARSLSTLSAGTKVIVGPDGVGLDLEVGPRPFGVFLTNPSASSSVPHWIQPF